MYLRKKKFDLKNNLYKIQFRFIFDEKNPYTFNYIFHNENIKYVNNLVKNNNFSFKNIENKEKAKEFLENCLSNSVKIDTNYSYFPIKYYYSKKNIINGQFEGRSYSVFTALEKNFRNLLIKDLYLDFDIENCYPSIIFSLCKKYNIRTTFLKQYIENRQEMLLKDHEIKKLVLIFFNQAKDERMIISRCRDNYEYLTWLQNESVYIREQLYHRTGEENIFSIVEKHEEICLRLVYFILNEKNLTHWVLFLHDGFYILKNYFSNEILFLINRIVSCYYKSVEFVQKKIETNFVLDKHFNYPNIEFSNEFQKNKLINRKLKELSLKPVSWKIDYYKFLIKYNELDVF